MKLLGTSWDLVGLSTMSGEEVAKAFFRLQANPFCFSNLFFNTDCPHCHLQVIRSDLLRRDITALYRPICMSCCGKDVGVSTCTGEQLYKAEVRRLEKCRYIISLSKHLHCQVVVFNFAAADGLSHRTEQMNITMFCAATTFQMHHLSGSVAV